MRVITGTAKGRKLKTLEGLGTRPTADRVKESMFNILSKKVINARCLDLFGGSGNLGIEAISRGALNCTFVEKNKDAFSIIKENIDTLNFSPSATLIKLDAFEAMAALYREKKDFSLIFLDPPYGKGLVEESISHIIKNHLLAEGGIIVSESDSTDVLPENIEDIRPYRSEKYGRTVLTFWSKE